MHSSLVHKLPELFKLWELTPQHFSRHPVWMSCSADDDEWWYDATDEETYRPWTGALPADPSDGMLLAQASLTLADGTQFGGFVTPASPRDHGFHILGIIQPHLFLASGVQVSFWEGSVARTPEKRAAIYEALERTPAQIFPVRFCALPGLVRGVASGYVEGFYAYRGIGGPLEITR